MSSSMYRKRRSAVAACSMERPSGLTACSSKRPSGLTACSSKRPSGLTACSNKRPRLIAISDEASSWASLPADLVRLIGSRVLASDLRDYVCFRAVCPHWRSSSVCPRGRGVVDPRFHPRRWMMLPEGDGLHPGHGKLRGYIRFFNLSTAVIVRVLLPLFRDHCILDSVDGLLLLQRDQDTVVRLLNPFTGDIADLPPLSTFMRFPKANLDVTKSWFYIRNICATSFSVSADEVITVMIVLKKLAMLAFATTRDHQWNVPTWRLPPQWRPISSRGKIYMLDNPTVNTPGGPDDTRIIQIDPPQYDEGMPLGSASPTQKLVATCPISKMRVPRYLAECDSEVLVIGFRDGFYDHPLVYRLSDLVLDRVVPVTSIGDNVLLIDDRILSVSPSAINIVAGSVVKFRPQEKYLVQCQLGSSTWSQAADGHIAIRGGVLRPYSLIYHIYTCCHRSSWNKGVIRHQHHNDLTWKVKRKWRHGVGFSPSVVVAQKKGKTDDYGLTVERCRNGKTEDCCNRALANLRF